jgi:hypothetical protein
MHDNTMKSSLEVQVVTLTKAHVVPNELSNTFNWLINV